MYLIHEKFHGSIIYEIASEGTKFCIEIVFTLLHQGSLLYTFTFLSLYIFFKSLTNELFLLLF